MEGEVSCPVATAPKKGGGGKKRFELKKWQAVAMWTWGGSPAPALPPRAGAPLPATAGGDSLAAAGEVDRRGLTGGGAPPTRYPVDMDVDNCAICRNHIMELCIECQVSPVGPDRRARGALPPPVPADPATDPGSPGPGDGARDHRRAAGGVHVGDGGVQPRVPHALHLAVAQDPAGVPAVQRGVGVPEVRPLSRGRSGTPAAILFHSFHPPV